MFSPVSDLSARPPIGGYTFPRSSRTSSTGHEAIQEPLEHGNPAPASTEPAVASASRGGDAIAARGLTPEEEQIVAELAAGDRQVRAHEQAHLAAAGGLAGGVSFSYTTGPDGRQYAVGGEVSIDTSPVSGDPAATIRKAQQIRAAANAPANPSGQDRAVAAQASQLEAAARQELVEQTRGELEAQNRSNQARAYGGHGTEPSGASLLSLIA